MTEDNYPLEEQLVRRLPEVGIELGRRVYRADFERLAKEDDEVNRMMDTRTRTAVFFGRNLYAMGIASKITEPIDITVGEPKVEEIEPLHMSFLISPGFNFAVARLNTDVEGPIVPVEGKLGVYGK